MISWLARGLVDDVPRAELAGKGGCRRPECGGDHVAELFAAASR